MVRRQKPNSRAACCGLCAAFGDAKCRIRGLPLFVGGVAIIQRSGQLGMGVCDGTVTLGDGICDESDGLPFSFMGAAGYRAPRAGGAICQERRVADNLLLADEGILRGAGVRERDNEGEPDAKGFLFRATLRRSKAALFLVILASGELYSEGWNGGRASSAGAKARIQAMKLRNRIRKPNRQLSLKHFASGCRA